MTDLEEVVEYVRARAARTFTPEGVEIWLRGRNPLLEGRSVLEALEAGESGRVLDLLDALESGAVL